MAEKKITISARYDEVIAVLEGRATPTQDLVDFIIDRKEKHEKRGTAPSKAALEKAKSNEELMRKVYDSMESGKEYTVSDVMTMLNVVNQKATYILTQMKNDVKVSRTERKGKAYFTKIEE